MRNTNVNRLTLMAASIVFAASHVSASEKLSDILVKAKWDGIIGTWVDADSKGAALKTMYAWKIEDRVIEVTQYQGKKQDVGLMGINGKTGEVFYMGASSDGTSSLGKWEIDDNGDAVLSFGFTTGDGHEGVLSIRHQLVDKDTMIVTIELDQPIVFKMIRAKASTTCTSSGTKARTETENSRSTCAAIGSAIISSWRTSSVCSSTRRPLTC